LRTIMALDSIRSR